MVGLWDKSLLGRGNKQAGGACGTYVGSPPPRVWWVETEGGKSEKRGQVVNVTEKPLGSYSECHGSHCRVLNRETGIHLM